ncbi:MAG: HDOD domain-containing protein [Deltaproteobacteria bacterium]|nr:HDOD domain-containing protein [Deltaproteobacteria bacterium]
MTTVLFVDDEPILLRTLRRGLAQHRPRWSAHFAGGAVEALAWLAENPVDVVVTDVSMPGMDGLTFLGHVREQHPHMGRIVLSGNAVGDLRGLVSPHQWLSKPCSVPAMCATIDRVQWAKGLVAERPDLAGRVLGQTALPSPPPIYARLVAAFASRVTRTADIVAIVGEDPAIAAKLLQLASSSFFGEAEPVASIERAMAVLGTQRVGMIVLSAELFRAGAVAPDAIAHSQRVARIAQLLCGAASDAFVAGLLHRIGAIAAGDVVGLGERDVARLGGLLLGTWGLPLEIASAVAFHRDPEAAPDPANPTLATLVLADALARGETDDVVAAHAATLRLDPATAHACARRA